MSVSAIVRAKDFYIGCNLRVFPLTWKAPMHKEWQTRASVSYSADDWAKATGIGLVCGGTNVVSVVDIDRHVKKCPAKGVIPVIPCACEPPLSLLMPLVNEGASVYSETPSGGFHVFYADPHQLLGCSAKQIHPQIDTKGQGKGYVVLPPSKHEKYDGEYRWVEPYCDENPMSALPRKIVELYRKSGAISPDLPSVFQNGTLDGDRHDVCAKLAGVLWNAMAPCYRSQITDEKLLIISHALRKWDERNDPPLGNYEVDRISKSVGKTHYGGLKLA